MDNTNWSGKGQGLDLPLTLSTGQVNINLDSPVETSVLACKNCNELIVFHVPGLMKKFKKQLKKNQLVGLGVTMGYLNIHDFDADQLVYHCLKYLVKQRNPLVHSLHSKVLDDEQLHTSIIYYVYNKLAPEYDVVPISISEVVVKRDEEIEAKNAEIAELRSTVAAQEKYIATQDESVTWTNCEATTIQSRCIAGVANGTFVFALPGSSNACATGWDKLISHQLNSQNRPCNMVDIMPRLKER